MKTMNNKIAKDINLSTIEFKKQTKQTGGIETKPWRW